MQIFWGKLLGFFFGYMFAGPIGALLGLFLGHNFDKGLNNLDYINIYNSRDQIDSIKSEFFKATFSVMGHLARADGVVTKEEISMATRLMDEMGLSNEQRMQAIELFRQGKNPNYNIEKALRSLAMACAWRHDLLQVFLEIQFQAAYADGEITNKEKSMLMHVCVILGFSRNEYYRYEAIYNNNHNKYSDYRKYSNQTASNGPNTAFGGINNPLQRAYDILGVKADTSYNDLKKAYRRRMSEHHPDKLIARGLPNEMLKLATEKTQEIKWAYDEIKTAKGWR